MQETIGGVCRYSYSVYTASAMSFLVADQIRDPNVNVFYCEA